MSFKLLRGNRDCRFVDARSLGRAGMLMFVGVIEFAFFFVLSEIYYPGYSVSTNYISDLGATCTSTCQFVQPSSMLFNTSISILGLLLLGCSFYLWKGFGSKPLTIFAILSAIGTAGVGIFNESFGTIHGDFSSLTFLSIGIFAVLAYRVVEPPISYFSLVAGIITLTAAVLYGSHAYLGLGAGGMERMVVYPVLLWAIGFGGYLMAIGQAARGP